MDVYNRKEYQDAVRVGIEALESSQENDMKSGRRFGGYV